MHPARERNASALAKGFRTGAPKPDFPLRSGIVRLPFATRMATYIYETIPADPEQPRRRFEVQQSMKDTPLSHDPQTGEPVRRVITGGYGLMGVAKAEPAPAAHAHGQGGGGCCGGMCGGH
jgi:hypothetical protein